SPCLEDTDDGTLPILLRQFLSRRALSPDGLLSLSGLTQVQEQVRQLAIMVGEEHEALGVPVIRFQNRLLVADGLLEQGAGALGVAARPPLLSQVVERAGQLDTVA